MRRGVPASARESAGRLAARLAHDVGKYVARTARNVGEANWTPELAAMLYRDLFALPDGRASAVFADRARAIEELVGPRPALEHVRAVLAEIDALETSTRRSELPALVRAARLSLAVETALREFARNLQEETP
jgi:hypothetical protein